MYVGADLVALSDEQRRAENAAIMGPSLRLDHTCIIHIYHILSYIASEDEQPTPIALFHFDAVNIRIA